jgi:nucleotide-binding universal stress UspA family protein
MTAYETNRRVVVGYDGGDLSLQALMSAARYAAHEGALLDVVYVLELRPLGAYAALPAYVEQARDAGAAVLDQLPRLVPAGVRFQSRLEEGEAGRVLVQAAKGADLLVVGSTTRHAMAGLVLGSVTLHCVLHAACPVLVVPPSRAAQAGPKTLPAMAVVL